MPKKSSFSDRKDSFSVALRQNKWHAPVKKHEIMQKVLEGTDVGQDGKVDLAIMAHQI